MRWNPPPRAVSLALTLVACGDGAGPADPGDTPLPPEVLMSATAFQEYPDGSTVTCSFLVRVSWTDAQRPGPDRRVFHGVMGGEAARQVLAADGSGLAIFADMAWPTSEARVFGADSVEFDLGPGDPESRFWDAFKGLTGTKDAGGTWSGPWTCHPLDLNSGGYVDTAGTAVGRWEVVSDFVQRPPS
jgi:hypothetical protein